MKRVFIFAVQLFGVILISSCNAFMVGFTQARAEDKYYLLTEKKNDFGNKRLKYISKYYKSTVFTKLLADKGKPDFAYEYKLDKKYAGIRLYYNRIDSVFILETGKQCPCMNLKESRKMDDYERQSFIRLQNGK